MRITALDNARQDEFDTYSVQKCWLISNISRHDFLKISNVECTNTCKKYFTKCFNNYLFFCLTCISDKWQLIGISYFNCKYLELNFNFLWLFPDLFKNEVSFSETHEETSIKSALLLNCRIVYRFKMVQLWFHHRNVSYSRFCYAKWL